MDILVKSISEDKILFRIDPVQMSKLEYDLKLPDKDNIIVYNNKSYVVREIARTYCDEHDMYGKRTKLEGIVVLLDEK